MKVVRQGEAVYPLTSFVNEGILALSVELCSVEMQKDSAIVEPQTSLGGNTTPFFGQG